MTFASLVDAGSSLKSRPEAYGLPGLPRPAKTNIAYAIATAGDTVVCPDGMRVPIPGDSLKSSTGCATLRGHLRFIDEGTSTETQKRHLLHYTVLIELKAECKESKVVVVT